MTTTQTTNERETMKFKRLTSGKYAVDLENEFSICVLVFKNENGDWLAVAAKREKTELGTSKYHECSGRFRLCYDYSKTRQNAVDNVIELVESELGEIQFENQAEAGK